MERGFAITLTPPEGNATDDEAATSRMLVDVVDTVRHPLLMLDAEFRVTQANRAFYRTFGVTPGETIGEHVFTLGNGQWNIAPLHTLLHHALPQQAQLDDFDVEHVFPRIGRRVMLLNARLISLGKRVPRMILLAIEDVTERRDAERKLAMQRRELQRSNTALNEFASVASHDLQEPLRKILAFGERLDATAGPALEGEARGYLDRMLDAAARMRSLITDLLAYAQVTTVVQPFAPTDLSRVARQVVADLETSIADAGGRVEIGELPVIEADPLHMRQLMQNLLSNAIKYRRPGEPLIVQVRCSQSDAQHWTLTVSDNGIGFNERYAERIFRMFERLHTRKEYQGSGIGLAICRSIAEHHGGTITATSTPGRGSTFTVVLPSTQMTRVGM